jgi:CubicO group peptidase (beta-lactamase class C family)
MPNQYHRGGKKPGFHCPLSGYRPAGKRKKSLPCISFNLHTMRICYATVILIVLSVCLQAQDLSGKIENYLSAIRTRNTFNGTALIVHKGKILLYKAYGYKDLKNKIANDTSTIYRIGSLSKPFTAALIMLMEQEQRLRLQDPLSTYIPDFPKGHSITIEELLTHSSGIKDYLQVKSVQRLPDTAPPVPMDTLISYFSSEPLIRLPEQKFSYSNSNYILLARIVEKITGKKFERVVREKIFEPLHMDHSGFDFKHLASAGKATGHVRNKSKFTATVDFDSTYAPGCGSMYASAMDLYRFYRGLCTDRIFDPATRQRIFTPRHWLYGYGWFVYDLYGRRCISHAGGVPGFICNLQFYPDDDLCIVLLSNTDGGDMIELSDTISSLVFQLPYKSSGL